MSTETPLKMGRKQIHEATVNLILSIKASFRMFFPSKQLSFLSFQMGNMHDYTNARALLQ